MRRKWRTGLQRGLDYAHFPATELSFCSHGDNSSTVELMCRCGEQTNPRFDWTWNQTIKSGCVGISDNGTRVRFNESDSEFGSAVVGSKPLEEGKHHFWQIKLTAPVYGRSLSIGVVSREVVEASDNLNYNLDYGDEGWRLNYTGDAKHKQIKTKYGNLTQTKFCESPLNPKDRKAVFAKGSLITIYLDTIRGTLEYIINGYSQGIAFTGLKGTPLYPLVYGAAPKTGLKLVTCRSYPNTLEFQSAKVINAKIIAQISGVEELFVPAHIQTLLNSNFPLLFPERPYDDLYIAEENTPESQAVASVTVQIPKPVLPNHELPKKKKIKSGKSSPAHAPPVTRQRSKHKEPVLEEAKNREEPVLEETKTSFRHTQKDAEKPVLKPSRKFCLNSENTDLKQSKKPRSKTSKSNEKPVLLDKKKVNEKPVSLNKKEGNEKPVLLKNMKKNRALDMTEDCDYLTSDDEFVFIDNRHSNKDKKILLKYQNLVNQGRLH